MSKFTEGFEKQAGIMRGLGKALGKGARAVKNTASAVRRQASEFTRGMRSGFTGTEVKPLEKVREIKPLEKVREIKPGEFRDSLKLKLSRD
ncbi:MAG: hypothetical protein EBV30_09470 [Actinobacteria bacterium]|nr:hypothetical protein [Actinomycetota bacterium]